MRCFNFSNPFSRRELLQRSSCGFAGLSLAAMAGQYATPQSAVSAASPASDLRNPIPHLKQRARRIIFLFMWAVRAMWTCLTINRASTNSPESPSLQKRLGDSSRHAARFLARLSSINSMVTVVFGSANCFPIWQVMPIVCV